jgi:hypothetical protein
VGRELLLNTPLGSTTTEYMGIMVPLGCGTPCGNERDYYLALQNHGWKGSEKYLIVEFIYFQWNVFIFNGINWWLNIWREVFGYNTMCLIV